MPTETQTPAPVANPPMVHPAMRRKQARKKLDNKQKRTTVRTVKLVNATDANNPQLIQVPIEPGHNNRGILSDPTMPIRHYLDKGFAFPHEFTGKVGDIFLGVIFCAIYNCWETALATNDPEGSERCPEHEEMYAEGLIRYATSAKVQ